MCREYRKVTFTENNVRSSELSNQSGSAAISIFASPKKVRILLFDSSTPNDIDMFTTYLHVLVCCITFFDTYWVNIIQLAQHSSW